MPYQLARYSPKYHDSKEIRKNLKVVFGKEIKNETIQFIIKNSTIITKLFSTLFL